MRRPPPRASCTLRGAQLVAVRLDAHHFSRRREAHALADANLQRVHVDILELKNLRAIEADQVAVVRVIHVVRIVELVVAPEIHLTQHPALHEQRQRAIHRRARDGRIHLLRHQQQIVRRVMLRGAERRLDDCIALRSFPQSL